MLKDTKCKLIFGDEEYPRRVICGNIVGRHVAAEAPINYPSSAVAIYLFHRCQQEDNQQPLSSSHQEFLKVLQIQFLINPNALYFFYQNAFIGLKQAQS